MIAGRPGAVPASTLSPIIDELASDYANGVKVVKLNVDENPLTASQYGIHSIPTMLFFKEGKLVQRADRSAPQRRNRKKFIIHNQDQLNSSDAFMKNKANLMYTNVKFSMFGKKKSLLPNGKSIKQSWIDHKPTVAIVAINDKNEVLLIKQYRNAVKKASSGNSGRLAG